MKKFSRFLAAAILLSLASFASAEKIYTKDGLGASGYDVVAYFTDERATPGSREFTVEHEGATWRFVSEANRQLFLAEPERYLPRYGGYCAYAVSQGQLASTDPYAWNIHEGKLFLNYSKPVRGRWLRDLDSLLPAAEKNWPVLNR